MERLVPRSIGILLSVGLAVAVAGAFDRAAAQAARADRESQVDAIFSRWDDATPGCAVGVAEHGTPVLAKAYGMADLERGVANTPETVFEAGSVSKQFTAAAVLLLARDGKLSLDDPVRTHVPELPDYGVPLTIRHMLTHTSGLRDWGNLAGIAGWPRTTRAHTHAHVLDIVSRQRALNFQPGARYSYSNTGYNLSAIIVSRVSGVSFAEFTRARIFEPLGMSRTSWRDDHTRIVKDRAIAYVRRPDGFHILMPFENVHGNGGLLTTVGDLLKWNENFVTPTVGDRSWVAELQQPGLFNDGRAHGYAFGLRVDAYKGVHEVGHSGSTAGYRAHLVRYPDQHVSVAVLCNGPAPATEYARAVADLHLASHLNPPPARRAARALSPSQVEGMAGLYKNSVTGVAIELIPNGNTLRVEGGAYEPVRQDSDALVSIGSHFEGANGERWTFDGQGGVTVTDRYGTVDAYQRVAPAKPTGDRLKGLLGTYLSDEVETAFTIALNGETLGLERRPDELIDLRPVYDDAFDSDLGFVIFERNSNGRAIMLSLAQPRVWKLDFMRRDEPSGPAPRE